MKSVTCFSFFLLSYLFVQAQIASITNYGDHSLMWEVAQDGNDIWTCSDAGLLKWDMTNLTYEEFTTREGLLDAPIYCIEIDNEHQLWLGTSQGVAVWKNNAIIDHITIANGLPHDLVIDIEVEADGTVWVSTYGGGLARRSTNGEWTYWKQSDGLPTDYLTDMELDDFGNAWVGIGVYDAPSGGHLVKIDNATDEITAYSGETGFNASLRKLTINNDGNIWFGTYGDGAGVFDPITETATFYGSETGIFFPHIAKVVTQDNGDTWFIQSKTNANYGSLYRLSSNDELTHYENWELGAPTSAFMANDKIYMSTREGFTFFDLNTETYSSSYHPNTLPSNIIRSMAFNSENKAFIATAKGLVIKEGAEWVTKSGSDIQGLDIRDVAVDTEDGTWVGLNGGTSNGGFAYINQNGFCTSYNSNNTGITSSRVMDIFMDSQGNRWFGGETTTAAFSDPDGGIAIWHTDNSWSEIDVDDGLIHDDIIVINEDPLGRIWVGTQNGLSIIGDDGFIVSVAALSKVNDIKFDPIGNAWVAIGEDFESWNENIDGKLIKIDANLNATTYQYTNEQNELLDFTALEIDAQGNIWVGTLQAGLFLFDNGNWQQFNHQDGLVSNKISYLSLDATGQLWVGSTRGISVLELQNTVSISELETDASKVIAFPNPAQNQLYFTAKTQIKSISIFDNLGKRVLHKTNINNSQFTLDVTTLPLGIYHYRTRLMNDSESRGNWLKN